MSIDSYRKKIKNTKEAKTYVIAAIGNYKEASEELKKIKGIPRCIEFQVAISMKIEELENLIIKMEKDIDRYNAEIRRLQRLKAAEAASKGGE